MPEAVEEVALVVVAVEEDAEEAEAEVEAEVVEVVVTPHLLRRLDRVLLEVEEGEETVFSTKPRCSNN